MRNCFYIRVIYFISLNLMSYSIVFEPSRASSDPSRAFGLTNIFYLNSGFANFSSDSPKQSSWNSDLWMLPTYRLGSDYTLKGYLILSKDFVDERKAKVSKTDLGVAHNAFPLSANLKFEPTFWTILPLAEGAYTRDSLRVGLKANGRFTFRAQSFLPLSGYVDLAFTRYFHQFTVSTSGVSNSQYRIFEAINLDLELVKSITLGSYFGFSSSWTYGGNIKNTFLWNEEIAYDLNPQWGFGLGISNEANAIKANGYDSNISLTNVNSAVISASVVYKY